MKYACLFLVGCLAASLTANGVLLSKRAESESPPLDLSRLSLSEEQRNRLTGC